MILFYCIWFWWEIYIYFSAFILYTAMRLHICIYMLLCLYTYRHMLFMYTLIYVFTFLYLYIYMCVHVCMYIHVVLYRHVCISMLRCLIFLHMLCTGKEIGLLHPLLLSSLVLQLVLVAFPLLYILILVLQGVLQKTYCFRLAFLAFLISVLGLLMIQYLAFLSSFRFSLAPSLLLFISLLPSYPYPRWIYV